MVDSTNLPDVDINQIATDLNGKMDRDGVNASCPTLLSRTANSNGGVTEIWSDGYCVQTGIILLNFVQGQAGDRTINLTQAYINTNYTLFAFAGNRAWVHESNIYFRVKSTNSFVLGAYQADSTSTTNNVSTSWRAEGYIR